VENICIELFETQTHKEKRKSEIPKNSTENQPAWQRGSEEEVGEVVILEQAQSRDTEGGMGSLCQIQRRRHQKLLQGTNDLGGKVLNT